MEVRVELPKFRIDYDIDLKEPLQKTANFSGLFDTEQQHKISNVKHKAYLDVNEAGSEAAAVTFMITVFYCFNMNLKVFLADHPFVFAICSDKAVLSAGHVAKF